MRWRPPTRPLILIALLLLVGAVVNVGVACVCAGLALHTPPPPSTPTVFGWKRYDPADFRRVGWGWRSEYRPVAAPDRLVEGRIGETARRFSAGWPLLAIERWDQDWIDYDGHRSLTFVPKPSLLIVRGVPTPEWVPRRYFSEFENCVPVLPRMPGFAINTLFYAALLGLPLSAFPIRRRLRARRGRCTKCGYDRAGLVGPAAPCPECGAAR